MKVGVKFCGNCNPYVDMPAMLQLLVAQDQDLEFVHWESPGYGTLLILSACPVGCASRPSFLGPAVFVTSDTINHWPVSEKQLQQQILIALRESETNDTTKP